MTTLLYVLETFKTSKRFILNQFESSMGALRLSRLHLGPCEQRKLSFPSPDKYHHEHFYVIGPLRHFGYSALLGTLVMLTFPAMLITTCCL